MAREIKNIGASVRARLLSLAKASGQSFELVLTRFALERLLFRLGQSRYADRFVLKGAMLLMIWFEDPFCGTRDLDLLGFVVSMMPGCLELSRRHSQDEAQRFPKIRPMRLHPRLRQTCRSKGSGAPLSRMLLMIQATWPL
jgi:Nucleotidyl transferase AbiEii toxin, Type IV TA system